ncbi:MAG: patatin-like phospholipase family protein [Longimicrobiales bacterium]|nr:patatin-like phospholipase family protein [Longimicrobiales bacterium]
MAPPKQTTEPIGGTGLLLLGGGARAAYAVGFLRCLARRLPDRCDFTAIAGVSSGAINAAYLASQPGAFHERAHRLAELWERLEPDSVMRVGTLDLLGKVLFWGARLVGGGKKAVPRPRALVDCEPLRRLLDDELNAHGGHDDQIPGIAARLVEGPLRSVLLTTTSYTTGESVVWSQGAELPELWRRGGRRAVSTELTVRHVMASAALPLLFPAQRLGDEWHGDGEVRLDSPLSPLVALGVDRIFVVSTHHGQIRERPEGFATDYPSPGQVAGTVVNAAFLHHLSSDVRRLRRVNHLVDRGYSERAGDGAAFRKIGLYVLRPSCDLEAVAGRRAGELPPALRWMIRGLGTHATASPGVLSLLSFQPDYIRELLRTGEEDAERQRDAIRDFLDGEEVCEPQARTELDELRLR